MKITLANVSPRRLRPKSEPADALTREFALRASQFAPMDLVTVSSEAALLALLPRQPARPAGILLLFDSAGEALSSDEFAALLRNLRDAGAQHLVYAIGPADGWSPTTRSQARRTLSLGRITLPHELARAVAAEQLYRALTILAGHPYHSGH